MSEPTRTVPILTGSQFPGKGRRGPAEFKGQLFLENPSGNYYRSTDSGKDVLWERVSLGTPEELANTYVLSATSVLNLKSFGAVGDGVTNDTAAVLAWLVALGASTGRTGYAPTGVYMVDADSIDRTLIGATIRGDGDRRTGFKARTAGNRLFDFRESGMSKFEDFYLDGDLKVGTLLDLGNATTGASTGNKCTDVRIRQQLDKGYDLTNNGDTVITRANGGPWPDTATGIYWPNGGGNNLLIDPKLFPADTDPGPGRASVEAGFQNMDIRGGALMGLKVLDNSSSQTLRVAGVQFYAMKNGANVIGPKVGAGLYSFIADGATKFATRTAAQSYFDGSFQYLLSARGCTFNSGATDGTPNAFGADFKGSHASQKLLLEIVGGVLRAESGATTAAWNDTINANVEKDYRNFGSASTHRNSTDRVRAGDGGSGKGLTVGAGVLIRQILSSALTPSAWATAQTVPANGYIATTTAMGSIAQANGLFVECAVALPDGITAHAKVASAGNVRIEVHNNTGTDYTLPAGVAFRVYAFQI